ncbi:hypothetical protein ACSW7Y_14265, partial [Curtobacterium flaccumfaciens]
MPDSDRPRRPVPAWVTAPPEDALEARPAPAASAPVEPAAGSTATSAPVEHTAGSTTASARATHTAGATPVLPSVPPGSASPAPAAEPGALTSDRPDDGIVDAATPGAATPSASSPLAVVVPDFPPDQDLLPPAPTSPAVHTLPFDQLVRPTPAPVSPVDAGPLTPPAAATPAVPPTPAAPVVGQPRFSVPGLEHVVVAGTEPA